MRGVSSVRGRRGVGSVRGRRGVGAGSVLCGVGAGSVLCGVGTAGGAARGVKPRTEPRPLASSSSTASLCLYSGEHDPTPTTKLLQLYFYFYRQMLIFVPQPRLVAGLQAKGELGKWLFAMFSFFSLRKCHKTHLFEDLFSETLGLVRVSAGCVRQLRESTLILRGSRAGGRSAA